MSRIVICALYKFIALEDYRQLRRPLLQLMQAQDVRGTLLLAHEGINGTLAGTRQGIDAVMASLRADPRLNDIETKESYTDALPFKRPKVKLKKEIVTLGVEGLDPARAAGAYVRPQDWNRLISDPGVLVIDTRNDYEYRVGTFKNAINPNTSNFREFPDFVKNHLDPARHKKIAMFCTGGIRCEKSTALLKSRGFSEVYHLKGGILKYLEQVSPQETLWEGECFVFDERVTVNVNLEKGRYDQCHACRMPITDEDKAGGRYQAGCFCPHCYEKNTPERSARLLEREKQIRLARKRGESHMGSEAAKLLQEKRLIKLQRKKQLLSS